MLLSLKMLTKWLIFSTVAAFFSILLMISFRFGLSSVDDVARNLDIAIYFLPPLAALLCGLFVYKFEPGSAGEGIPSYIKAINQDGGWLSAKVTFFKYIAGLITLGFAGSGGIVGPLGRVNAGIMSLVMKPLKSLGFREEDRRTSAICGVAAIFAVTFHTPIAGGLFAVEVLKRAKMGYLDLFPSILSSCFTVAMCKFFSVDPFYSIYVEDRFLPSAAYGWVTLIAFTSGVGGLFFSEFYAWFRTFVGRDLLSTKRLFASSLVVSLLGFAISPLILGTSFELFEKISRGELVSLFPMESTWLLALSLFILAIAKTLSNCITVGAGMSAGFAGPAFLIGLLIAAGFAAIAGIDTQSSTYYAFLAAGMSGMLAATMNVPLAAAIMGAEVFGSQYSFPAALSAILAFQVTRKYTIYDLQIEHLAPAPEESQAEPEPTKKAS